MTPDNVILADEGHRCAECEGTSRYRDDERNFNLRPYRDEDGREGWICEECIGVMALDYGMPTWHVRCKACGLWTAPRYDSEGKKLDKCAVCAKE